MKKAVMGIFVFFMIFTIPAFSQRNVLFPHFATGGGWSSDFFFTNQGLSSVPVAISFYDEGGNPVSVNSNLGAGDHLSFTLNGGTSQALQLAATGSLVTGYALTAYPDAQSAIRGTVVYKSEQAKTVVGVSQQEFGQHYSFPVEVNTANGVNTGIALAKPAAFSGNRESVVVNLLEADGTIYGTRLISMGTGEHKARFLNEADFFPGLDNFIGSVSISSPFGVGVVALREDKQAYGAVSTDRGPVLFPFMSSGAAIPEVEPNDDKSTAQLLSGPAVVNGSALPSDVDMYKFAGKSGDVVSIICDTTQKNSDMDPVLFLVDADFNPVSANDSNGLAPRQINSKDAFIQSALPKDGTYYIVVLDSYGSSGAYTLHVNAPQ
jgi:hypothetical protein